MDFLINHVEALIFCSPQPLRSVEIQQCLSEMFDATIPIEDIDAAISSIGQKFKADEFAFELLKTSGGYQFFTKPAYQASISILLKQQSRRRLSTSSLETLSIIAYRQPITKSEVEKIRGVNCDYAIQRLLEKELVQIQGKSETVGRPIIYVTSSKFMEYFGINDLKELPTPKDFAEEENAIGEQTES